METQDHRPGEVLQRRKSTAYRAVDAATGGVLAERLRPAHTHWTRLKGLLGTNGLDTGDGLWLKPCRQVHMIGMRFAIDVVFLDAANRVVHVIEELAPGKISPKVADATSVLELPVGTLARVALRPGTRIEIEPRDDAQPAATEQATRPIWLRCVTWTVGFILVTSCFVLLGRRLITTEKVCPVFTCYWAAGKLLAARQGPYDLALLAKTEHEYGWDKATDGMGYYDFLPYHYPPSLLGLLSVLLVPLGFSTARIAWLVINAELLFISGYILRNAVSGFLRVLAVILVPVFWLSVLSVVVGQATSLILFLMVAAWRLLQRGWDRSAGWVLAWMSIKPQLSTVLVLAALVWLARQQRWRAIEGFAVGSILLLALSQWVVPWWPIQLVRNLTVSPVGTTTFPWAGTSWLLVLRSLGLDGWALWPMFALVALPFGWLVLRCALRADSTVDEVFALGILAAFVIAPTAGVYDQPILLLPLLILIGAQTSRFVGVALLAVFLVFPYVQVAWWVPANGRMPVFVWFSWIPLLLASLWVGSQMQRASVRAQPHTLVRASHV